jgi:ankyrin repeat protein
LELTRLFLSINGEFIRLVDPTSKENCVFRAADRGSLHHVKFFLDAGADIDAVNDLGNSALWIACAKRYTKTCFGENLC